MSNRTTIDDLLTRTPGQLCDLPVEHLAMLADDIHRMTETAKAAKERLNLVIKAKYIEHLVGHQLGTKRVADGDYEIVVNYPKNVSWDNKLLEGLEQELDPDGLPFWKHYDVKRTVPEAIYNRLPESTQAILDKARTVKGGAQTVKFERKGGE